MYELLKPGVAELVMCNRRRNALLRAGNKNDRVDARAQRPAARGSAFAGVSRRKRVAVARDGAE